MKVLSYNLFGIKNTEKGIPSWELRMQNIQHILTKCLKDKEIKVCCFQEVNKYNMVLLEEILSDNNFQMLEKFPMKTEQEMQYNIIAIKKEPEIHINSIYALPHGKDKKYQNVEKQIIDYEMSDYRTTIFVIFTWNQKKYIIGNIHTDYISTEGKIKGTIKSLNELDGVAADEKILIGDMNMISHMSEAYNILKQKDNYTTLSRNKKFQITDNSFHGYGLKEQVNVDFAFILKVKKENYEYEIIKQKELLKEGSDHHPIIITINEII